MNVFDKYYSSQYVPQYAPLPVEEIGRGLDKRQALHEQNLAGMDQLEDIWANLKFLPQDEQQAKARLQGYRKQFDEFAQSGDYSQARPFVKRVARAYVDDLTGGYLGATQQSYQNYYKDIENIDKSNQPVTFKQGAKSNRFNRYKGIDPSNPELFQQVYRTSDVPEYVDALKEVHNYLKDMKPTQDYSSVSPWFKSTDGRSWLQNSRKLEELPASVLYEAGVNILKNNPKVQEQAAFAADAMGKDPQEYFDALIKNAAVNSANILAYRKTQTDQDRQNVSELEFGFDGVNNPEVREGYTNLVNDNNKMYFKPFKVTQEEFTPEKLVNFFKSKGYAIKGVVDDNHYALYKDGKFVGTYNSKGTTTKYGSFENAKDPSLTMDLVEFSKTGNEFNVDKLDPASKAIYNRVYDLMPGKTAEEKHKAANKYLGSLETLQNATAIKYLDRKSTDELKKRLGETITTRNIIDLETGKIMTGTEFLTDPLVRATLKNTENKNAIDVMANINIVGKADPDNPYKDITGKINSASFVTPTIIRVGDREYAVSQDAYETSQPMNKVNSIINDLTRSRRSGLPSDASASGYPEIKSILNPKTGKYDLSIGSYNVSNVAAEELPSVLIESLKALNK